MSIADASVACKRFNPRAREGRDSRVGRRQQRMDVSIHAPARGATINDGDLFHLKQFQSTRPRGARQ